MLVGNAAGIDSRQANRFQPTQHTKLGFRIAPAIEYHDPEHRFDIQLVFERTHCLRNAVKAQFVPELR